ncbi:MAG: hypothetical protein KBT08_10535 [Bacteroidales bacterium]|nr:hypothetical protein [Candidatus Cryptobacteroides onthequi]
MKIRLLIAAAAVTAAMASCSQHGHKMVQDGEFRSMIRLWSEHHLSDTLESQLVDALRRYPDCCDEVWFYDGDPKPYPLHEYERRAEKMAKAAQDMRDMGIIPSLQTISIGHPTHVSTPEAFDEEGWRAMTSIDGVHAASQTCPRDTMFLKDVAWRHAFYARYVHPECIYMDDDLRITSHFPAKELCFCDECIAQYNAENGSSYTREQLKEALNANVPGVRSSWIRFSQESLAMVARAVSKAVHEVSPQTHMGLQHVNFHTELMEGWDWNPIFDAMEEETGLVPYSRPGHGYYNDHKPRTMIEKAYGISRQIARLNPDITMIAPEIEGHRHKATGKSPQSVTTETLLYLGMGATSMSYALICSALEPMDWYADTYLKALDSYHELYRGYVAHNKDTKGSGIDSYISPNHVLRDVRDGEPADAWKMTTAGDEIFALAPLGIAFTPESGCTSATVLDLEAAKGMSDEEIRLLLNFTGVVMDPATLAELESRDTDFSLKEADEPEGLIGSSRGQASAVGATEGESAPKGLQGARFLISEGGQHIAVLPSFSADVTNAERLDILHIFDWASKGHMSVILESMAQAILMPRVSTIDGSLRSVVFVNATISDLPGATLRLRGCPAGSRISWEWAENRADGRKGKSTHSTRLDVTWEGNDAIVTLPVVKAWDAGYVKIGD